MIDLNPKFKIGEIISHNSRGYEKLKVIRYQPEENRTYYILSSKSRGREVMLHIDTIEKDYKSESEIRNQKIDDILK